MPETVPRRREVGTVPAEGIQPVPTEDQEMGKKITHPTAGRQAGENENHVRK